MIAIGLATYLIVFNLTLIVQLLKKSILGAKTRAIDIMQQDSRASWKKKGKLFHQYEPRTNSEPGKPSEWWVLVYLLQKMLDAARFWRPREGSGERDFEETTSTGRGRNTDSPV